MIPQSSELTGLSAPHEEHGQAFQPPKAAGWMSQELVEQTRQLWSRIYGRILSEQDAIEILTTVHRLAEVVLAAQQQRRPL